MNWKSYSLGCLTSFVFLFFFVLAVILASFFVFHAIQNESGKKIKDDTYLLLDLDKEIEEYQANPDFFRDEDTPLAINILREKLFSAVHDKAISGIIVKISGISPLSYSQADELANCLQSFKEASGKKVLSYIYFCTDTKFLVASCTDKIYLNPSTSAGISLLGFSTKRMYMKSLLDKIGVDVTVIRVGNYKSYGEVFTKDEPSKESLTEIKKVYGEYFDRYQSQLAQNLNLPLAKINKLYADTSDMIISGENALELVDSLAYYQEFLSNNSIENVVDIEAYKPKYEIAENENKVAVVYLSGSIDSRNNDLEQNIDFESTKEIFEEIEEDSEIKAVVVRVTSPGGSALASHLIAKQVIKKCKIPVVISMGSVAASGGYYLASSADYIFAEPYTITGSIGVFALLPNAEKLSKKIGINYRGVSFGQFAESMDIFNPQSPKTVNAIQKHISSVYDEFCTFVADNRNIPLTTVKNLAQGKIYTATQAKSVKLVDEVGYLEDAILKANQLAKIETSEPVFYPEEADWWKSIFKNKLGKVPFLKEFMQTQSILQSEDLVQARIDDAI